MKRDGLINYDSSLEEDVEVKVDVNDSREESERGDPKMNFNPPSRKPPLGPRKIDSFRSGTGGGSAKGSARRSGS